MIKKLVTIIIIVGILIALSPIAGKLYLDYRENKLLNEWYNSEDAAFAEESDDTAVDPEEAFSQLQEAFSPDASGGNKKNEAVKSESAATKTANSRQTAKQIVLGIIKIDKIKIKYPIVDGVKASDLKLAIGHISGTAGLGQNGNCALAGHRNYTFGRFFNRLDEIQNGDIISVFTKKEEFRYKVYDKLVVKPDDVSVINGENEDPVLTLITCTPIYIATHRLIVKARLEEKILLEQ